VGAIARRHGEDFKRQHALTEAQRKVLRAVAACRTPVLGGRLDAALMDASSKGVFFNQHVRAKYPFARV